MKVDLTSYIFEMIEYDPTENPRGVVTADEWNTILNLLKSASNYTSKSLQEIVSDLYTASELSSTEPGNSGSNLIGVDPIPGLNSTLDLEGNVNKALKELVTQIQNVVLGEIPPNSVTSDKLVADLNFRGNDVTFNDVHLLNANDIVQTIDSQSSTSKVASAKAIYDSLVLKQDDIKVGTSAPTSSTSGDIYIQLEPNSIDTYTKDEVDTLLKSLNISGIKSDINSIKSVNNTQNTNITNLNNKINTVQTVSYGVPTMHNNTTIIFYQIEKVNKMVHALLEFTKLIVNGETVHVATLPEGFRPTVQKKGMVYMRNEDFDYKIPFLLDTDGKIKITNTTNVHMLNHVVDITFCIG